MTRARDLSKLSNSQVFSVDSDFQVGINSTVPAATLDVRGNSVITGVLTATSFSGTVDATGLTGSPSITVTDITASGNVSIAGTLTYEDVTNIDAVGVITARSDVSIADKIIHTGDTNTAIRFPAADTFTVETAGSERVRVDSSGNLGIGTDSPSSSLHLLGSAPKISLQHTATGSQGVLRWVDITGTVKSQIASYLNVADSGNIEFCAGGTSTVMELDSAGRLLLGTTTEGEASADDLTIANSGDCGLTIRSGTSSKGKIFFSDGTSGLDESRGYVQYEHTDNVLRFGTDAAEAARFDSSQRLLIGSTSARANFNNGTRTAFLQLEGTSSNIDSSSLALIYNQNSTGNASNIYFGKTRGGSVGDNSALNAADDRLGNISFQGNDGTQFVDAAHIRAFTDATPGADDMPGRLVFSTTADGGTSPTERLRINSGGQVTINTTVAQSLNGVGGQHNLVVAGSTSDTDITDNSAAAITISNKDGTADNTAGLHFAREDTDGTPHYSGASVVAQFKETQVTGQYPKADLAFLTSTAANNAPSEKMRITAAGYIGVNDSSPGRAIDVLFDDGTTYSETAMAPALGAIRIFNNSTTNNATAGEIVFGSGDSGTAYATISAIRPGSQESELAFRTSDSATLNEALRINKSGHITNKGSYVDDLPGEGFTLTDHRITITGETTSTTTTPALRVGRDTHDGELVSFHQDSTKEGFISVSGSTVSYNGGHLSRWSQTLTTDEHTGLLKGTVMTNLDEMCQWVLEARDEVLWTEKDRLPEGVSVGDVRFPARAAGFEDNEQLNKMAVSSVEGDPNVAGAFVNIDEDGDLNVAMTGDFIIRIAQDTTVARGDLLMSAGDGTAKPQGDDIVRSKTIAKVTSTTKSVTYSDGSYCVPCVLMAC